MNKEANFSTTIYLVRHGESEGNLKQVISGHTDHELTSIGEMQATELGKRLRDVKFDRVFSSDLIRAKRTAELIMLDRQLAITTTQALRERNYGDFEGKAVSDLHTLYNASAKLSNAEQLKQRPAQNAESGEELVSRFTTFLREIAVGNLGKTILVTAHGGVMYSFLTHLGIAEDREIKKIKNAAWLLVESDGIDFEIKDMEGVVIENEVE